MVYNPISEVIDEKLHIDKNTIDKMSAFRAVPKLTYLPGVDPTLERDRLSKVLEDLVDRLILGIEDNPTKLWVLTEFQRSLELVEQEATEGREHFGTELEKIMDILGIESSDGLLSCYLGGV